MLPTTNLSKHVLSKSTFLKGCQCEKALWLYKHMPELKDDITAAQQSIFAQGTDVGNLAKQLFPGGIDASPASKYEYQQSVIDTSNYIAHDKSIIYEAAFQFDGVLAALDILVKVNGDWFAYEVKSSTEVKEQFIKDAALQYHIITSAGIPLKDIFIVHINNKYTRNGALDVEQLFTKVSVLKEVRKQQTFIVTKISELKDVLLEKEIPVLDIGHHCNDPYACDFTGHCWKHIPENSVFDLRGRGASETAIQLYRKGILTIENIPDDFNLTASQLTQVMVHKNGNIQYNEDGISAFLNQLQYPLYFLDFETFSSAVPDFDGCKPYQQIPFQFSLHILKNENILKGSFTKEDFEHKCFLAEPGTDPKKDFIEALLNCISSEGSVIVYNKAFENRILKEEALQFPQYADEIENIQNRMVDLMSPFRSKYYYVAAMKGSYSIKDVLPALVPELNYDELPINNGGSASQEYYQLQFENDLKKIEEIKKQLLDYCELDTWAMVKLLEKLNAQK